MLVLTVNVGTAPRTIMSAPMFNPIGGNAARARDLLQLCNQRAAAAKGSVIAAPRCQAPDGEGGDALMGDGGAVAPGAGAPADVNPPPASEHADAPNKLTAAFTRPSVNPHVAVLEDSIHSEAFGPAIQKAAPGMVVVSTPFSQTPYDEAVPIRGLKRPNGHPSHQLGPQPTNQPSPARRRGPSLGHLPATQPPQGGSGGEGSPMAYHPNGLSSLPRHGGAALG